MTRPVRIKRVPKRFDDAADKKSPAVREAKKVTRERNGSKKNSRSESDDKTKKESVPEAARPKLRNRLEKNESQEKGKEDVDSGRRKESKIEKETRDGSFKGGNKFFKSKKPLQVEERRVISKRSRILRKETGKDDSLGFVAPLRQTTLSESFGRGARARLRPRKVAREYKDASILEKSVSPDKRNSVVVLERIDAGERRPVYKTVLDVTQKDEDKDSVYDFRFDSNDPTEKPKKKKRVRRAVPRKKPAPIAKPRPRKAEKKLAGSEIDAKDAEKEARVESEPVKPSEAAAKPEKVENLPARDDKAEDRSPRLRISNVERLTGDRKVSFKPNPSTSTKFNPFRSTQSIFGPRPTLNVREMMDHSLLNKSLSPIRVGEQKDAFDAASPWRPPAPESFFKVRQVVQSTPQIKRNFGRLGSPTWIDENEENLPRLQKSPDPLGVRTSNASNTSRKVLGLSNAENRQGFGDRLYKSPKKSDKVLQKRSVLCAINEAPISPLHKTDENIPPLEESRLMKQSNLNSFLNIDEMPESISISTSHGIFGDAHSTPVVQARVVKPQQDDVQNYFGFDDDENSSDAQVSPIKETKQRPTPVKKIFDRLKARGFATRVKKPARISLGEIKNTLYPRKEKKPSNLARKVEEEEAKSLKNNKKVEDAVQFSDTFDVMPENGVGNEAESSTGPEIALFADIEPVHFTKPPRWSYSKKRDRKQYWSDEEADDDDDQHFDGHKAPVLKKRRVAKVNKVEEKKIEDWVKSVNETFQEIDDFDLVVEKLH